MKRTIFTLLTCVCCLVSFAQDKSEKDSIESEKKVSFVGIPMLNYSNSFGVSLGVYASAFYDLNANDTISPHSSSGVFGIYTSNKTWFAAQINKLYLNEDKIRIKMIHREQQ